MKDRLPLQIVEGRLVLTALTECRSLRMHKQIMEFVIDTGSPDSYLSNSDIENMQIPMKGIQSKGEVDFGGSRFKQFTLPKMTMHILKEDKQKNDYVTLKASLSALKTTKTSEKKRQTAHKLPSILGMSFLKEQRVSLHVILTEDMAYLQCEAS